MHKRKMLNRRNPRGKRVEIRSEGTRCYTVPFYLLSEYALTSKILAFESP